MKRFKDRREAGAQLAIALRAYRDDPKVVVLGLPRGGVVVGAELAKALNAPLDVFLVRKIGVPCFSGIGHGCPGFGRRTRFKPGRDSTPGDFLGSY